MPASTINTLTIPQLTGLSIEQSVSLYQSPYKSFFSKQVYLGLKSSIDGTQIEIYSSALKQYRVDYCLVSFFLFFYLIVI